MLPKKWTLGNNCTFFPRKKNPNCEAAYSKDHLLLLWWKRLFRNVCDFCVRWTGRGHLSQGASCRRDFQGEQILFLSFCTSDLPSLMFWEWGGPGCPCSPLSPQELLQVHCLSPSQAQLLLQSCSWTRKENLEKLQVIVLIAGLANVGWSGSEGSEWVWICHMDSIFCDTRRNSARNCFYLLIYFNHFWKIHSLTSQFLFVLGNRNAYRTYFSFKN